MGGSSTDGRISDALVKCSSARLTEPIRAFIVRLSSAPPSARRAVWQNEEYAVGREAIRRPNAALSAHRPRSVPPFRSDVVPAAHVSCALANRSELSLDEVRPDTASSASFAQSRT